MANPRAVKMAKLRENERLNKQFVSLATPAGGYNRGGSPNTYSQMRTPEGGPNRGGSPNTYSQVRTPEGGPNRGGSPNTYSQMRTPEGGSNRGGSGKPKFTRSTVFDESGETLEEINVDENDIKTTTKVFTPATALEQAETAMREEELGYPAGPPNAYDMLSMQEQERFDAINAERRDKEENAAALGATVQELYPTVETFNGPSISKVPSPHLGELEMNGQLSSSMLLANGSNNGRGGNRTKAGTNNEKMVWSERLGRYITMDEYLGVADQFPSAPSDKQAIYNSDLQQWVLETTPALSENDVGVLGVTDEEAYSAQTAMAAELESDYLMGMDESVKDTGYSKSEGMERILSTDYSRGNNYLNFGTDQNGKGRRINLSYINPWAAGSDMITAAVRALDEGENVDGALKKASIDGVVKPIIDTFSPSMVASAVSNMLRNENEYGQPIYKDKDSSLDYLKTTAGEIYKAFEPGGFKSARDIVTSIAVSYTHLTLPTNREV